MNKKTLFFTSIFLFFSVLSLSVFAQKTATTVISDVLNMNLAAGQIGFSIQVVSPKDVKYAEFFVASSDVKIKNATNLPNSPTVKFFTNKVATGQTFVTGSGANSSVLLSLSQPGLLLASTVASLGSFVHYPSNPAGAEIKFNIPSNLSVLNPNATTSANTLFGKTTITTKTSNGQTFSTEDVIYIKITPQNIGG